MSDSKVRRRKPLATIPETKSSDPPKPEGGNGCRRLFFVCSVIASGLGGVLLYAFVTSPIFAVVVTDFPEWNGRRWKLDDKALQKGRKLHANLFGPESIAFDDEGNLYTGLENGRLIKIKSSSTGGYSGEPEILLTAETFFEFVGKTGRNQTRPLGVRYLKKKLYFADAYQGIFVYDLTAKKLERIVAYDDVTPPMKLTDDLDVTKDGKTIYFTDASARWTLEQLAFEVVEGTCTGRVFRVELSTKKIELLFDGLCLANGVQLNFNEKRIFVCETTRNRVRIFDIDSTEAVKSIYLPGGPDNIRPSQDNGYWVGIPVIGEPSLHFLYRYPVMRTITAGLLGNEGLFRLVNLRQGLVAKLSKHGELARFSRDTEGKLSRAVTQATETKDGRLFLVSYAVGGLVEIQLEKPVENNWKN